MKESIRCFISCILPCGALDVIRIVHSNGRVEEISGSIQASEIMKSHPKHVLKKIPSSSSISDDALAPKIIIVSPETQLRRGKIYFLVPAASSSNKRRSKKRETSHANDNKSTSHDGYLSDILSEKLVSADHKDGRKGRVTIWRPNLEGISESQ
ncbi:hypothetical protein ACFE04_023907 [Oxalis oulophora]